MNAEEHRAWSDAVFDARYLDMDVPKQLVQKFAILSADTELRALRERVALLEGALEWYGDEDNYSGDILPSELQREVLRDYGTRARKALGKEL